MSSNSSADGGLSDHGAQLVESIEPVEDTDMQDVDDFMEQLSGTTRRKSMKNPGTVIKRKQIFDDSKPDETDCPGNDSDSSKKAAQIKTEPHDGDIMGEGKAPAYDFGTSPGLVPLSYQKPPAGDSDAATDETDSIESTEGPAADYSIEQDEQSRKRKAPTLDPDSQGLDGCADAQPKKRSRNALTRAYLDLLNQDIKHYDDQYLPPVYEKVDERMGLPSSQIGMTMWTSIEKERFFEALGRLGRDNTAGIAERIHTKGEIEVRQYMQVLQDALTHRRQQNEIDPLGLEHFPAAVEISQECCQALEDVADSIARRQERSEIAAEEDAIGPHWLFCQEKYQDQEQKKASDDISRATRLFRGEKWLSLSERFFMNAPNPEGNWQEVAGNTPGLWLTALDDFHSLALILTRRLVSASQYMAASRVRAERGYKPQVRQLVKEKDVLAAIKSLGGSAHKHPLTDCVRRLGLSVFHEPPKPDGESDSERISVTDIEGALDAEGPKRAIHLRQQMEHMALSSDESSISSDSPAESEAESDVNGSSTAPSDDADSEEEEEVRAEASEAILHSAVDPPQTKRDRQALYRRIKAEREQERYADAVDMQASYQEELQMWSLLGRKSPESLIQPESPPPGRRLKLSVDAGYTVGKAWRAKTKYMSEWEAHY